MAKETELKRIDLKVSVNCCDGCKRKVKKVLQSVEGVLKTEIDPMLPKVTVLGNVNPQILIKNLLKTGKQAQLWNSTAAGPGSGRDQNIIAGKEKKEADHVQEEVEKEKDKSKSEAISCGKKTGAEQNKETRNDGRNKDYNETGISFKSCNANNIPPVMKSENPTDPQLDLEVSNFNQYCYKVEPCAIALPCYAIPTYTVPPVPVPVPVPPTPTGYGPDYLLCQKSQFPRPAVRIGDYFSDENTVGCYVM